MIFAESLSKSYGRARVLRDVSFIIGDGAEYVFGSNKKRAYEIEAQMEALLAA